MKKILIILTAFTLSACAGSSATKTATEALRGQITTVAENVTRLHDSLPERCRPAAIEAQFQNLQSQIDQLFKTADSVWDIHTTEMTALQKDYDRRGLVILLLVVLLCVFIFGSRRG